MKAILPHMMQRAAKDFPGNIAFKCGPAALTYEELSSKSNALAAQLLDLGVKKGDRVGIYLNRSIECAIAIYGIMTSGAAYVPLDPFSPPSRTKQFVQDCEIEILVTSKAVQRRLESLLDFGLRFKAVIGVSSESDESFISWDNVFQNNTDSLPAVNLLEDDLAYIMYTSGSTGTPKGIMHTHFSGFSYARLSAELYGLVPTDVLANHAPLHFDISTLGYFSGPYAAACTVIIPEAYTKMPASLSKLMEDEQISIWYSVPLALIQLLTHGILDQRNLSSIRWVLYGGEPFPLKYLRELMTHWPQATISNVYGPAEVNQCTFYNFDHPPKDDEPVPLGRVWNETEMIVLDESDNLVKTDQIGELLIKTITMMRGYWNQPVLTANSIYYKTGESGEKNRYYRTGDLVYIDENELLHFVGRKDRQIKTRGYRVELDEVEAALVNYDLVQEAAVFPVENEDKGLLIEDSVIPKEGTLIDEQELLNFLKTDLSWYSLPQKIHITDSFPRTSTGKIDRRLLQEQHSKLTKA